MKSYLVVLAFLLAGINCYSQSSAVIICKGRFSERYHARICSGLNNCRGGLAKVTIATAKSIGRTPCITCYGSTAPHRTSIDPPSSDGQCRATTKKGTRCSRSSRSGGYCWQHGG